MNARIFLYVCVLVSGFVLTLPSRDDTYVLLIVGMFRYDEIWRDLRQHGLLQHSTDGHTYRVKHMASKAGQQFVRANFQKCQPHRDL